MTNLIGTAFAYKGKPHLIKSIESRGVIAKPCDSLNGPLVVILPIDLFNQITGNNVEPPPMPTKEDFENKDLINKVESIRFMGGENGRQYIDRYLADGYNKIISYKTGAVNKYYLLNEQTNFQIPVSGVLRKYAETLINSLK